MFRKLVPFVSSVLLALVVLALFINMTYGLSLNDDKGFSYSASLIDDSGVLMMLAPSGHQYEIDLAHHYITHNVTKTVLLGGRWWKPDDAYLIMEALSNGQYDHIKELDIFISPLITESEATIASAEMYNFLTQPESNWWRITEEQVARGDLAFLHFGSAEVQPCRIVVGFVVDAEESREEVYIATRYPGISNTARISVTEALTRAIPIDCVNDPEIGYVEYLRFVPASNSGFDVHVDGYGFTNTSVVPDFERFVEEFGDEDVVYKTEKSLQSVHLGVQFPGEPLIDFPVEVPVYDEGSNGDSIMSPVPLMFQQIVQEAIYDNSYASYYNGITLGGMCLGMVGTAADFYVDELAIGNTIVNDKLLPDVLDIVDTYHMRQLGNDVLLWLAQDGEFATQDAYNRIKDKIGDGSWYNNPDILGVTTNLTGCDEDIPLAHALLPYAYREEADGSFAYISVYDPNHPNDGEREVIVNLKNGQWRYQLASGVDSEWDGDTLLILPVSLLRELGKLPSEETDLLLASIGMRMNGFAPRMNGFARDEDGNIIGCVEEDGETVFTKTVRNSFRFTQMGGAGPSDAEILVVPAGKAYSFHFNADQRPNDASESMSVMGLGRFYGVVSDGTTPLSTTIQVNDTFSSVVQAIDVGGEEIVSAILMAEDEEQGWTRSYALSGMEINDSHRFAMHIGKRHNRVHIENLDNAVIEYDLSLSHVGLDGASAFSTSQEGERLRLNVGETHIASAWNWRDIENSMIFLYHKKQDSLERLMAVYNGGKSPTSLHFNGPRFVSETTWLNTFTTTATTIPITGTETITATYLSPLSALHFQVAYATCGVMNTRYAIDYGLQSGAFITYTGPINPLDAGLESGRTYRIQYQSQDGCGNWEITNTAYIRLYDHALIDYQDWDSHIVHTYTFPIAYDKEGTQTATLPQSSYDTSYCDSVLGEAPEALVNRLKQFMPISTQDGQLIIVPAVQLKWYGAGLAGYEYPVGSNIISVAH